MSNQEIKNEILSDIKESRIYERAIRMVTPNINKYRRIAYKQAGFHVFEPITLKSKRGNLYYYQPYTRGKSSYKKEGVLFAICTFFLTKHGLCCALITKYGGGIALFYSHLFKRYAERYDHSGKIEQLGIVKYALRFVAENSVMAFECVASEKYGDNSICAHVNHGLVFGNLEDDIPILKTFVSSDMLYDSQNIIKENSKDVLSQYMKKDLELFRYKRIIKQCA